MSRRSNGHRFYFVFVSKTDWFFRVFGYGLSFQVVDLAGHRPLFSERYGHRRFLYLGTWRRAMRIRLLRP